jgi:hypothetical protein
MVKAGVRRQDRSSALEMSDARRAILFEQRQKRFDADVRLAQETLLHCSWKASHVNSTGSTVMESTDPAFGALVQHRKARAGNCPDNSYRRLFWLRVAACRAER